MGRDVTMTERHKRPITLRNRAEFLRHVGWFLLFASGFLFVSLGLGVLGYHVVVGLDWIDSLLNASMILTGMGPVDTMPDDRSKIFASLYAIFGGAVYPAMTALILYPFVHRMMVILHLQARNTPDDD
jgi:hypothetical protein